MEWALPYPPESQTQKGMDGSAFSPEAQTPNIDAASGVDAVLHGVFGFSGLRPGQERAIDALLAGDNVLAVMPTGAGKSLCFQIPALVMEGLTIVVSPLVALMRNQVDALKLNGVAADAIHSDRTRDENVAIWRAAQRGELKLLYMSPERLMTDRMLAALARLPISLIAIDEAHCISQWGPAFRPEYNMLCDLPRHFPGVPIAALTATADPSTSQDICDKLFSNDVTQVMTGFDRPNLSLSVSLKSTWKKQVVDYVDARRGKCGIVYCLSRRKTEEVAALLRGEGHNAYAFHAGMEASEKEDLQNRFMTEEGVVMAATVAFGMGIDKPDIRYVLHTDLPASFEAYYQEIGRAGRDGAPAEAMMLYGLEDIRLRRTFIEQEDAGPERKRREHKRMDSLLVYCEAPDCRRQVLLRYFGEPSEPCGNCDTCLNPVETMDGSEPAQQVLGAVQGTGNRYGAAHIVAILRGTTSEKIESMGHDRLPQFGVGAARSTAEWQGLIRQMVANGLLEIDIQGYGGLRAGPKANALMQGEVDFRYRPDRVAHTAKTAKAQSKNRAKRAETLDGILDSEGRALLARLKELRLTLAKERNAPAYVIFSDKSLIDMAHTRPRNKAEFSKVFGVGQAKLDEFADTFLEEIARAV